MPLQDRFKIKLRRVGWFPASGHFCRNTIQVSVISDDSFSACLRRGGRRERTDAETREDVGGNTNFQRDTRSLSTVRIGEAMIINSQHASSRQNRVFIKS